MSAGDRVIAILEQMSGKECNRDSRLHEDLELDSLDRVQVAISIEEHLGLHIPDEDVDNPRLGVASGLIAYVEARLRQGAEL